MGLSLLLLIFIGFNTKDINGVLKAIQIIDLFVVIPEVIVLLITGILFSLLTNWGFIKHRWIIVKYIINILPMILGGVIFAPSLVGMMEIAEKIGQNVILDPAFIQFKLMFLLPLIFLILLALLHYIFQFLNQA